MKRKHIFPAFLFFCCMVSCNTSIEEPKKPNILVLFSDELQPSYISAYGGDIATPNIDALASQGIRFEHAYTPASMCTPSRFAFLTGQYPGRCEAPEFKQAFPDSVPYSIAWNTWITPGKKTIASILSAHGYETGAVGKWHVGLDDAEKTLPAFERDANLDDTEENNKLAAMQEILVDAVRKVGGFDFAASIVGNYDNLPLKALHVHNFEWITEGAIEFLEKQQENEKPFFLYCATTGIHGPRHDLALEKDVRYTPEGKIESLAKYQQRRDEKLAEMSEEIPGHERHLRTGIWFIDQHVKDLMTTLDAMNMTDNTIVLFMADHNIEPGKATCYNRGIHVPFIIHWPEKMDKSEIENGLVSSVDVLPTILDIAGIELPQDYPGDGKSFLPMLEHKKNAVRESVYAEAGYSRAVSDGKYKYIAYRPPESIVEEMKNGEMEYAPNYLNTFKQAHSQIAIEYFPSYFEPDQLFDLEKDPYEQKNLAFDPKYASVLDSMKHILKSQLQTFDNKFVLEVDSFFYSKEYEVLVQNTKGIGLDYIPWWHRDHGEMIYPPKE